MNNLQNLDSLSEQGRELLTSEDDPARFYLAFDSWNTAVSEWLKAIAPNSGMVSEWHSLGTPSSDTHVDSFYDQPAIAVRRVILTKRLQWLSQVPSRLNQESDDLTRSSQSAAFVDSIRLKALRKSRNPNFDLAKLIRLCEELNICSKSGCLVASIMLTRAIIDHVPPIFGYSKFGDVANQYPTGSKSFKDSMFHLDNSSRKIADQHLHCHIRKDESLPSLTQVNFSNDLDVLLAEIVRILKSSSTN